MNPVRIIAMLLLLLSVNSFGSANLPDINKDFLGDGNGYDLSEDFQDLSSSQLPTTLNLYNKSVSYSSTSVPVFENSCEGSRTKGYFLLSYQIEPGLGLEKIIFPFHSFL